MIVSDAAFKVKEGFSFFGFVMILNGVMANAGAIQRPKVASSKEAEERVVIATLEKARKFGVARICVLLDAKEVVLA